MTRPPWLAPLPGAEEMRAIDRWAIEQRGIPSLDLMERAGAGLTRVVEALVPGGPVAVVCGKGNNGGDGLVAARLLRDGGREVRVLLAATPAELSGDAAAMLERLPGPAPVALDERSLPGALEGASVIVDALLGTGFSGRPRGAVAVAIEALARSGAPVVSADVPSGVDASTGAVEGSAVPAVLTATFHSAKPGLWIAPGKLHAGRVEVIDIGIPHGAPEHGELGLDQAEHGELGLIGDAVLDRIPRRAPGSTKYLSGHVLLAGGSRGLTGAPSLSCLAAMRAGAGYVTACVPASLQDLLATRLLEAVTRGLPDHDGHLTPDGVDAVLEAASRGGALALGPGLGRDPGTLDFARALAARVPIALVLDADGLNAHAGRLADLAVRAAPTVLTPHAGELGRLLETSSEAVGRERLRHVRETARRANAVVVLKGDDTLVADPAGRVGVNASGSAALATAGTGDVLTGVAAALLAKGLDAFTAACAAVHLHGLAGREAARRHGGTEGVIASDVIDAIPHVRGA